MDTIAQRFAAVAELYPEIVAIEGVSSQLTYRELAALTYRMADRLEDMETHMGDGVPRLVAVLADRSVESVAAMFGLVLAGWAYLPLDPQAGMSALVAMIAQSGAVALLTDAPNRIVAQKLATEKVCLLELGDVFGSPPSETLRAAPAHIRGDVLAYVLFTPGTGGAPKPVSHTRTSLIRSVACYCEDSDLQPGDRVSLATPLGFTPTLFCLFGTLLTGSTLCPLDYGPDEYTNLGDWISARKLSLVYTTATAFRRWASRLPDHNAGTADKFGHLRMVQLAGEPLLASDVALFQQKFSVTVGLYNGMGTTQTSCAARFMIDHDMTFLDGSVPIGYPYDDVDLLIRNKDGRLLGAGEIGDLYIKPRWSGWDDALAEFNTGDVAMLEEGGRIVHFGRLDGRIHIDGVNVDPLEVESLLMRRKEVGEAAVIFEDRGQGGELAAFIAGIAGAQIELEDLRVWLMGLLPKQMIPVRWTLLESLPLVGAAKLDRKALRSQSHGSALSAKIEPRKADELDDRILEAMRTVLGRRDLAATADFFMSGGDALLALELTMVIEREFGVGLSVSRFMQAPTAINLAHELRRRAGRGDGPVHSVNDLAAVWQLDHSAPLDLQMLEPADIPSSWHELLVHDNSMTATLAAWRGGTVSLNVMAQQQLGRYFMRKVELVCPAGEILAVAGIRVDLAAFVAAARLEIIAGDTPFGTILQKHKIDTANRLQGLFVTHDPMTKRYGRLNRIEDKAGSVLADVIEVLTPDIVSKRAKS